MTFQAFEMEKFLEITHLTKMIHKVNIHKSILYILQIVLAF